MTKAIDKAVDNSVQASKVNVEIHADTLNTGEAVFTKGVLSFGMTEFRKDTDGSAVLDSEGKKVKEVVSTFAIRYHKGGVKRTFTEILKETVLPAIEASGMGESLAQSFVKTNIPVFLRKKLPNGFTGTLVQALNIAGQKAARVQPPSAEFVTLKGLMVVQAFQEYAACLTVIEANGWNVTKEQFAEIKNGVDPFRSDD